MNTRKLGLGATIFLTAPAAAAAGEIIAMSRRRLITLHRSISATEPH
jgi:hypothetical protein